MLSMITIVISISLLSWPWLKQSAVFTTCTHHCIAADTLKQSKHFEAEQTPHTS